MECLLFVLPLSLDININLLLHKLQKTFNLEIIGLNSYRED